MGMLSTALAIIALIGGVLSARAFLPHVNVFGRSPSSNLARGLVLAAASVGPRTFYWDVMKNFLGPNWAVVRDLMGGNTVNILFNLVLLLGIYYILKARLLTIPDEERWRYNIITAAFFPSGIWPRLTRRGEE